MPMDAAQALAKRLQEKAELQARLEGADFEPFGRVQGAAQRQAGKARQKTFYFDREAASVSNSALSFAASLLGSKERAGIARRISDILFNEAEMQVKFRDTAFYRSDPAAIRALAMRHRQIGEISHKKHKFWEGLVGKGGNGLVNLLEPAATIAENRALFEHWGKIESELSGLCRKVVEERARKGEKLSFEIERDFGTLSFHGISTRRVFSHPERASMRVIFRNA